jgi:hypothetical protein
MPYIGGWAVRVLDLLGPDELAIELTAGVDADRPAVVGVPARMSSRSGRHSFAASSS